MRMPDTYRATPHTREYDEWQKGKPASTHIHNIHHDARVDTFSSFKYYLVVMIFKKHIRSCNHTKMELTPWSNGEGFDVIIQTNDKPKSISLTFSEMKALMTLANIENADKTVDDLAERLSANF